MADRIAAGGGGGPGRPLRRGARPGLAARRGRPPPRGPAPRQAGDGADRPGGPPGRGRRPGRRRSTTSGSPRGSGPRPTPWPRPGSAWPTGWPPRSGPTSTPASPAGSPSGSRSWPGTRSAARPSAGPARSPTPGGSPSTRPAGASSAGPTTQLDRAERLAGETAQAALAAARRDVEARQKAAAPKVEALYAALAEGAMGRDPGRRRGRARGRPRAPLRPPGPDPGLAADRGDRPVLGHPPRPGRPGHPRRPRGRAVPVADGRDLAGVGPASGPIRRPTSRPPGLRSTRRRPGPGAGPGRARPARRGGSCSGSTPWAASSSAWTTRSSSAAPGPTRSPTSRCWATSSRQHATLARDGEGYVIRAIKPTFVNGQAGRDRPAPRRRRDPARLDGRAGVPPAQPGQLDGQAPGRQPPSAPAGGRRRDPDGRDLHRRRVAAGPHPGARAWPARSSSTARGPASACRAPGGFEVDGRACAARAPLTLQSSVLGEGFSFSLEPLGSRTSPV